MYVTSQKTWNWAVRTLYLTRYGAIDSVWFFLTKSQFSYIFNKSVMTVFFTVISVLQTSQNFYCCQWFRRCCYSLHLHLQLLFFQLCFLSQLSVHDACILCILHSNAYLSIFVLWFLSHESHLSSSKPSFNIRPNGPSWIAVRMVFTKLSIFLWSWASLLSMT